MKSCFIFSFTAFSAAFVLTSIAISHSINRERVLVSSNFPSFIQVISNLGKPLTKHWIWSVESNLTDISRREFILGRPFNFEKEGNDLYTTWSLSPLPLYFFLTIVRNFSATAFLSPALTCCKNQSFNHDFHPGKILTGSTRSRKSRLFYMKL